jgi:8-amino-7-oxononanoate synthase
MQSFSQYLEDEISKVRDSNIYRKLKYITKNHDNLQYEGNSYISFSCNDYLGLSQNKEVKEAAIKAIKDYGVGAGASRLVTGNNILYESIENKLAKIYNTDKALIFGSGYLANIGIISALMSVKDLVVTDKLIHACIIDGVKLSGAKLLRFKHNNIEHLEQILQKYRCQYRFCLILTENVFSMDGDIAPLSKIAELANKYDSITMSDNAHGLGISAINNAINIKMGTFSKAIGAYGGYVAGSNLLIDYLTNKARSLIFSTALPPSVLASIDKSLQIMLENPNLGQKSLDNARLFASELGLADPSSAIVPVIIGDEQKTMSLSNKLLDNGYYVAAIRPPTVPRGTSRLRVTFSARHQKQDIISLAKIIKQHIDI